MGWWWDNYSEPKNGRVALFKLWLTIRNNTRSLLYIYQIGTKFLLPHLWTEDLLRRKWNTQKHTYKQVNGWSANGCIHLPGEKGGRLSNRYHLGEVACLVNIGILEIKITQRSRYKIFSERQRGKAKAIQAVCMFLRQCSWIYIRKHRTKANYMGDYQGGNSFRAFLPSFLPPTYLPTCTFPFTECFLVSKRNIRLDSYATWRLPTYNKHSTLFLHILTSMPQTEPSTANIFTLFYANQALSCKDEHKR